MNQFPYTKFCIFSASVLLAASASHAQVVFDGAQNVDTDWAVGDNWVGDSLPTSSDTALVNQNKIASVSTDVNFGGVLTNQNSANVTHTSTVNVKAGGVLAVTTANNGVDGGGAGVINVMGGTMTTTGSVTNNGTITVSDGSLSLFNTATAGNNAALSSGNGTLFLTDGTLTAGESMTTGTIQFFSAIAVSGGSFTTGGQTFFSGGTSLAITGDAASISFAGFNQLASRAVDINFNFGATDVSTIVSSSFMNLAGATINVDGSAYTGGAGVFDLITSANYADDIFAAQSVSGFTGLEGVVSASGNNLILTLTTIPEPSAYALLGGLLALGCVVMRRRRA